MITESWYKRFGSRASDTSKINFKGVHQTGSTPPEGKVPSSFVTEVFSPTFLPELTLKSALDGVATPGKTIQPLPAEVVKAPNEPGINCQKCEPPADLYKLTKVEPTVKP